MLIIKIGKKINMQYFLPSFQLKQNEQQKVGIILILYALYYMYCIYNVAQKPWL